ncbi:uncharacterized protein LOC107270884 [Cephus cinctus]|uniref:Uncharacterized protein LOC107270884 n=1 Tax=Cephus cinctus TaxID=211228 RepID=A0AAJ7FPE8_CEPCN|nr:uncharacterized protein LOC107270884 [Cephus cinctus]
MSRNGLLQSFLLVVLLQDSVYTFGDTVTGSSSPASGTATEIRNYEDPIKGSASIGVNRYTDPYGGYTEFPAENSQSHEDEDEDPEGPPDHVIPVAEYEILKEVPTRPKYTSPGEWAKPPPEKNIPLDFVPTKLYAQVRGTHTVKRLPQEDAVKAATTEDEKENALRLRAVVTNSKVNTVYTEEGYEDSAYDHAGHVRDADFHEGYAKKLDNELDTNSETGSKGSKNKKSRNRKNKESDDDYDDDYSEHLEEIRENNKLNKGKGTKGAKRILKDWQRKEIDPKFVAENGIERLEDDLRREDEEAEKGSENYEFAQKNKDYDYDSTDKPRVVKKIRKYGRKDDSRNPIENGKKSSKIPKRRKQLYLEKYESTTPVNTERYEDTKISQNPNEEPSSISESSYYSPVTSQPLYDVPQTTIDYNREFWDVLRTEKRVTTPANIHIQEQSTIPLAIQEVTTIEPQLEHQTPVVVATINGHGPYLLVTDKTTLVSNPITEIPYTTNPSQTVQIQQNGQQWPVHLANVPAENYGTFDPTLIHQSVYESWHQNNAPEKTSHPIPTTYVGASSYPSIVSAAPYPSASTPSLFARQEENPLKNHEARAGYATVVSENVALHPVTSLSQRRTDTKTHNNGVFRFRPNDNYARMLNYLRREKNLRDDNESSIKKRGVLQSTGNLLRRQKEEDYKREDKDGEGDFTIMKPPLASGEVTYSDFAADSRANVASRSSAKKESETSRRKEQRERSPSRNSRFLKFSSPLGNNDERIVSGQYEIKSVPVLRLVPPSTDSKDHYTEYRERLKEKYLPNLPILPQVRAASFLRRKRSFSVNEAKIADRVIAYGIQRRFKLFNDNNDLASKKILRFKRNLLPEESVSITEAVIPAAVNLSVGEKFLKNNTAMLRERNRRSSEDLLNEAPKVAADTIDKEIKSRFNSKEEETEKDNDRDADEDEDDDDDDDGKVEVEVPELDYVQEIEDANKIDITSTTEASVDFRKYPFYRNDKMSSGTPLKYILDPENVPRKTLGGMEFYRSRDRYMECDDVDPSLKEVVPDDEEPVPNRGPKEDLPRLRGLGDKLDCFKAKYFDENPLDSPIFFEKQIAQPTPPAELNPVHFAERITELPRENDEYIHQKLSKKPEVRKIRRKRLNRRPRVRQYEIHETVRVNYSKNPEKTKNINSSHQSKQRVPMSNLNRIGPKNRNHQVRRPILTTTEVPLINPVTPYQKEVYEDVMGTIKSQANLYKKFREPVTIPKTASSSMQQNFAKVTSIGDERPLNYVTESLRNRNTGIPLLHITRTPPTEHIQGLLPPPERSSKILPHLSSKVPYNTRARTESPLGLGNKQVVGYYKTVKVHKRSVDELDSNVDVVAQESRRISREADTDSSSTTVKPPRRRRRPVTRPNLATPQTASTTSQGVTEPSQRPVYTIRDRRRNLKSTNDTEKHGKFLTQPKENDTTVRNEPRYTSIRRRKIANNRSTTTEVPVTVTTESVDNETTVIPVTETTTVESVTESTTVTSEENNSPETAVIEYSTKRKKKVTLDDPNALGDLSKSAEEEDMPPKERVKKYKVHEDVDESPAPDIAEIVKSPEYSELKALLLSDPPGYAEAFSEEAEEDSASKNEENNSEVQESDGNKEEGEGSDEDKNPKEAYKDESSSDEDEGKSSKSYDPESNPSFVNDDDKFGEEKKLKFFEENSSRPNSPSEIFDDGKYSNLGPRIHKPPFHHPSFVISHYDKPSKMSYTSSSEDDDFEGADKSEETESKKRYKYPWERYEPDPKFYPKYRESSSSRYEYPWERRERLERERRERRKRRRKLRYEDDDDDDDDEDEDEDDEDSDHEKVSSSSMHIRRYVYPWEKYDVPSINREMSDDKFWDSFDSDARVAPTNNREHFILPSELFLKKEKIPPKNSFHNDNDKVNSKYRPVTKFSSRYSSNKFRIPIEEILMKDFIVDLSNKGKKNSTNPSDGIETGSVTPELSTSTSISIEKTISNSKTVPEDMTTSSVNRNISGVTSSKSMSRTITRSTSTNLSNNPRRNQSRNASNKIVTKDKARSDKVNNKNIKARVVKPSGRKSRPIKTYNKQATKLDTNTATTTSTTTSAPRTRPTTTTSTTTTTSAPRTKPTTTTSTTTTTTPAPTTTTPATTIASISIVKPEKKSSTATKIDIVKNRRRGNVRNYKKVSEPGKESKKNEVKENVRPKFNIRRRVRPVVSTAAKSDVRSGKMSKDSLKKSDAAKAMDLTEKEIKNAVEIRKSTTTPINTENSTPKTRTIEHHSRVSKEEIITKTFYPEEISEISEIEKDSEMGISDTIKPEESSKSTKPKYKKVLKSKVIKNPKMPYKNESIQKVSIITKETPEHVYQTKEIDKDGHKGMFVSIKPNDHKMNAESMDDGIREIEMEELERTMESLKDFEMAEENSYQDEDIPKSDRYLLENPLPKRIPNSQEDPRSDPEDQSNDDDIEEETEDESGEESTESDNENTKINYIKNPYDRLYYYVDR